MGELNLSMQAEIKKEQQSAQELNFKNKNLWVISAINERAILAFLVPSFFTSLFCGPIRLFTIRSKMDSNFWKLKISLWN